MNEAINLQERQETISILIPAESWKLQVGDNDPIKLDHVKVDFAVSRSTESLEIASRRIAELLLSPIR